MIQVLLLIFKIIGITVLVILGLILLVLALVLFVPVFYRVKIIHNPDKTQIRARVSFLFPLLLVTFEYLKKISYKVRIFGFALLDSDKPKKEKRHKDKKVKKQNKKLKEEVTTERISEITADTETEKDKAVEEKKNITHSAIELTSAPEQEKKEEQLKKISFFKKIKCKLQKTRETISNLVKKIKKLLHQKDEVQRILAKPETKQAVSFAWDKLKHLLKHVFPRKIKGYLAYGADNPATTGQVLGVLSVIYARTGQLLEIRPNFMEKQLECDMVVKGRIQVFTLLVIVLKVMLNKELKQLITEFKNIKEVE